MNAILTGGNRDLFGNLVYFVSSLRDKGHFADRLIVCDTNIRFNRNRIKLMPSHTFTDKQMDFLKSYNVEVINLHNQLRSTSLDPTILRKIHTEHHAYPIKNLLVALCSSQIQNDVDKIAFFDSDFYFQKDVSEIFDQIKPGSLFVKDEGVRLNQTEFMLKALSTTNFSFSTDNNAFQKNLGNKINICAGFFAAEASYFNRFSTLFFLLATNPIVRFHNDQPLLNVLLHYFHQPYTLLPDGMVVHGAYIDLSKTTYDQKEDNFRIDGNLPHAIHFHGNFRRFVFKIHKPISKEPTRQNLYQRIRKKVRKMFEL